MQCVSTKITNIEQGISNYEVFLSPVCFSVFTLVTKIGISSLFLVRYSIFESSCRDALPGRLYQVTQVRLSETQLQPFVAFNNLLGFVPPTPTELPN